VTVQESTKKLYDAVLDALGGSKPTAKQRALMGRISGDYYHDFVGVPAMPAAQLVADLRTAKLGQLVDRVKAGDFEATNAEADAWAASPEGQQAYRRLLG
jgi:hypothetical protein